MDREMDELLTDGGRPDEYGTEQAPDYASFSSQREDLRDNIHGRSSGGMCSAAAGFVKDHGPEIAYVSLGATIAGVSVYAADPEVRAAVNDILGGLL
ncbi:MAG: hypothetical protein ABEJ64_03460 [Candidatus Nanohaloarchaea archaeon]